MTRQSRPAKPVSMPEALALVASEGFTPAPLMSWEDAEHVYAFSQETAGPGTYNAARCTVHYSRDTGWLTVSR